MKDKDYEVVKKVCENLGLRGKQGRVDVEDLLGICFEAPFFLIVFKHFLSIHLMLTSQ